MVIENLLGTDQKQITKSVHLLIGRHDTTILDLESALKKTINNPNEKHNSSEIIRVLGHYRAVHAVPLLVQYLEFSPDADDAEVDSYRDHHPCVEALEMIGFPSLGPLVQRAKQSNQAEVIHLCVTVITKVLGKNLAQEYLHERSTGLSARQLQEMLEIIDQLPEDKHSQPKHAGLGPKPS